MWCSVWVLCVVDIVIRLSRWLTFQGTCHVHCRGRAAALLGSGKQPPGRTAALTERARVVAPGLFGEGGGSGWLLCLVRVGGAEDEAG